MQRRRLTHPANRCVTERGEVVDPFHVFEFTDWVNVIAPTAGRRVLLVDEYRHGGAQGAGRNRAPRRTNVAGGRTNRVWFFLAINCRPVGDTRFDTGENIAPVPITLADSQKDLHAGRPGMQMAHLLGLFAAESFLHGRHDPSLAEIHLALA